MDKSLYKKILFADDDEAFRFTVQEYFSDSPWVFEMAENGVVALDKALETKFDLIILDINMPFMKGNETVREIKKKWPDVKVLAFTGFAAHDVVDNYFKDGFDDVISKHTELEVFHKIISQHLRSPVSAAKPIQNLNDEVSLDNKSTSPHSDSNPLSIDSLIQRIKSLESEKQQLLEENSRLKIRLKFLESNNS